MRCVAPAAPGTKLRCLCSISYSRLTHGFAVPGVFNVIPVDLAAAALADVMCTPPDGRSLRVYHVATPVGQNLPGVLTEQII